MVSKELLDLLNEALAREIQVSIQYMWQHVQWRGVKGFAVREELRKIAIEEMRHAEAIAERIFYLGGIPTTKPKEIVVGKTLREMIEQDARDEENAIKLYKEIIEKARKENDITTATIFEGILKEEEEHHDFFTSLLEEL
ncbi:MAG: ferritin-like domain-containing protein [Candidatus Nezhaarchaeota archaeon]|nr:ferritin-like domain-containing protein [Candidatus Nezhaarchaeota archaeon]